MEDLDITSISLRRNPCFGTCPVDEVTLHRDGTVIYHGIWHVERLGQYTGRFWPGQFRRLAELVVAINFFDLEDRYPNPVGVTDLPSRLTTVRDASRVKKVETTDISFIVEDVSYPVGLWALEMAIFAITANVKWHKSACEPALHSDPMWDDTLDR